MTETKPPKVFISYTWEDGLRTWVLDFATRLRSDGVNAILDQWETMPGDQLPEFMERSVRDSDFVVFVCTPTYKRKSDRRKGGVGYEGHIITGEVFQKNNHRKFIPVLRKGKWATASPSWATSKLFIDFRGEPYSEASYQQLLNTLLGKSPTAPPLRDNTSREMAEREAIEKADREKTEREIAEKAEREKEEREAEEKAAREKAEREAAIKTAQETADREAAEKATRERAKRESDEKAAQEKAEQDLKRKVGKLLKENDRRLQAAKRRYKWDKFFLNIRHKWNLFFIDFRFYFFPVLFGLIVITGLVYLFFVVPRNIPSQDPTLTFSPTFTPHVMLTLTSTFAADTLTPSSTSTEINNPTPTSTSISTQAPNIPTPLSDDFFIKNEYMVLVAADYFTMGSEDGNLDERPAQRLYLDSFYISQYEVSNFNFVKFLNEVKSEISVSGQHLIYNQQVIYSLACKDADFCAGVWTDRIYLLENQFYVSSKYRSQPVSLVTWYGAKAYCEWLGGRLPTEAEWEKAARGTQGRVYPWRDFPSSYYTIWDDNHLRANFDRYVGNVWDVDEEGANGGFYWYQSGNSPYYVRNMAGNVAEWVSSLYRPYPYDATDGREDQLMTGDRVVRGGGWDSTLDAIRTAARRSLNPSYLSNTIGFRCAHDASP